MTVTYEGHSVDIEVTVIDPNQPDPTPTPDPDSSSESGKKGCKGSAPAAGIALLAIGFVAAGKKRRK